MWFWAPTDAGETPKPHFPHLIRSWKEFEKSTQRIGERRIEAAAPLFFFVVLRQQCLTDFPSVYKIFDVSLLVPENRVHVDILSGVNASDKWLTST